MRITVKDHDFDSPYDNIGAAKAFRQLVEDGVITSDFALSLYNGAKRFGRYTPGQVPWLHVLVAQAQRLPTKPGHSPVTMQSASGYKKIFDHLTGSTLKRPVITLIVGDQCVVLKVAGPSSRNAGKVSVASGKFGQGDFYGYIDQNGEFRFRSVPQSVIDILNRVAENPQNAIAQIGRESGHCCYCNAELSTVGSKLAGCGPVCAENYSAWYPTASEIRTHIINDSSILVGSSDSERWV